MISRVTCCVWQLRQWSSDCRCGSLRPCLDGWIQSRYALGSQFPGSLFSTRHPKSVASLSCYCFHSGGSRLGLGWWHHHHCPMCWACFAASSEGSGTLVVGLMGSWAARGPWRPTQWLQCLLAGSPLPESPLSSEPSQLFIPDRSTGHHGPLSSLWEVDYVGPLICLLTAGTDLTHPRGICCQMKWGKGEWEEGVLHIWVPLAEWKSHGAREALLIISSS